MSAAGNPQAPSPHPAGASAPAPRSSWLWVLDWLLTLVAVVTAVALTWGAAHWVWWVLAAGSVVFLSFQIVRKLAFLHDQATVKDFPPGQVRRSTGTPSGRRLSKPPAAAGQ